MAQTIGDYLHTKPDWRYEEVKTSNCYVGLQSARSDLESSCNFLPKLTTATNRQKISCHLGGCAANIVQNIKNISSIMTQKCRFFTPISSSLFCSNSYQSQIQQGLRAQTELLSKTDFDTKLSNAAGLTFDVNVTAEEV